MSVRSGRSALPRVIIGVTAAALVASGAVLAAPAGAVTSGPAAPSAPTAPSGATAYATGTAALRDAAPSVGWGTCQDPVLDAFGAECGYVSVPLDHDRPRGTQIRIAVSRLQHTVPDDQYQGVMLTNPGGPGGSGLIFAVLQQFVPGGAGLAYDWIGFDPRGVGLSEPALSCIPDYNQGPRPIYEPYTPQIEKAWLNRSKAYAKACGAAQPDLLPHLTTVDSVKDMDAIRKALGEKQINFFGYSYGTYLGQVYATLFPKKVRKFVLDSNVDWRKVWYQANLDQDYAFERNFGIFLDWVAQYDSVYHLGTTRRAVEARFYAERARLAKNPAGGQIGASEWSDIFLGTGYAAVTWPDTAQLWSDWDATHSNPQPLIDAYGGGGIENEFAMYLGVQCVDEAMPRDWSVWQRDGWRTFRDAPFLTWGNVWFNAPCAFWPAKAGRQVTVGSDDVPPILLIDETLDAATPFEGSVEARRRFPNSRLLALPGGTNHAFSLSGNDCEDGLIAAFLTDGTLPKRAKGARWDATCAPLPVPDPTAAPVAPAAPNGASRLAPSLLDTARQELQRRRAELNALHG